MWVLFDVRGVERGIEHHDQVDFAPRRRFGAVVGLPTDGAHRVEQHAASHVGRPGRVAGMIAEPAPKIDRLPDVQQVTAGTEEEVHAGIVRCARRRVGQRGHPMTAGAGGAR